MDSQIDVRTLRQWLEEKRPVTVSDVRLDEDRAQWSIPGSIHVNAYEALKAGQPNVLSSVELARDIPVVTICNQGRVSRLAAQYLADRGVPALSLLGGMQAWTLAWNTAHLKLAQFEITQVRRTGKGCLSYLLSSQNEAIVIDASLEPELYVELSEQRGLRIRYVLDTHIHADHLSRSKRLAEATGAELWLPEQDRVHFPSHALKGGGELRFGDSRLQAIHTPGHTSESTCYFVDRQALFTGDTLFLSQENFKERILARIPPTPPNYTRITELNESGELPDVDITELEAGANRCAVN